jgi:hypothetical protein
MGRLDDRDFSNGVFVGEYYVDCVDALMDITCSDIGREYTEYPLGCTIEDASDWLAYHTYVPRETTTKRNGASFDTWLRCTARNACQSR